MPRDSDIVMFQHPEYPRDMYGVPTFALGSTRGLPLLMNRRGGARQYSEEELVQKMGNYAKNLGYVYNPNGLTYGDVNSLMNKSKQFWDDWDGNYQIYMWDEAKETPLNSSMGKIFNINDDDGEILGFSKEGYGVKNAETKEASVGMIVRDGDPSSPPSDIFMAETKMGQHSYETTCECGTKAIWDGGYKNPIEVEQIDWPSPSFDHFEMQLTMKCPNPECDEYHYCIIEEDYLSKPKFSAESFAAEDPTQADASNMGGPTAPGNAGVPADVGGDDLVPYDSPSAPPAGVFMNAEIFACETCGCRDTHSAESCSGCTDCGCMNAETLNADYKTYESKPVRNALFGVAFAVSGLYFWSTAGSVVKNWVVVRVEKYAPQLLKPQFQTMLTLTAFFGIIYFGMKLRGSSKGLTIPSMIDLSEASVEA